MRGRLIILLTSWLMVSMTMLVAVKEWTGTLLVASASTYDTMRRNDLSRSPALVSSQRTTETCNECSESVVTTNTFQTSPESPDSMVAVLITNQGLQPAFVSIRVGEAVAWVNQTSVTQRLVSGVPYRLFLPVMLRNAGSGGPAVSGEMRHTPADLSEWGAVIAPEGVYTHTFTLVGDYPYFIGGRPDWTGLVEVLPAIITPTPTLTPITTPTPTPTPTPTSMISPTRTPTLTPGTPTPTATLPGYGFPDLVWTELAAADCRACHGPKVADRHHVQLLATNPAPLTACVNCHLNNTVETNCLACHPTSSLSRSAKAAHHELSTAIQGRCTDCHYPTLIGNLGPPVVKTPPAHPRPLDCNHCHATKERNKDLHHNSVPGALIVCTNCHTFTAFGDPDLNNILGCERCHTPDTLHHILPHSQIAACAGCHGETPAGQPSFGPLPPALFALQPHSNMTNTLTSLVGENFGEVQDGSVTFGPATSPVTLWTNTQISATVPITLTRGNYLVRVNQAQRGTSDWRNFSVTTDSPDNPVYQKLTCANCHNLNSVFVHGFSNPDFKACAACHTLHLEAPGGPDCLKCHGLGGIAPKHIDANALGQSIHARLNATAVNTTTNVLNSACWACHGDGTQPASGHPAQYKTPKVCADCHVGSPQFNAPLVSEHFKNGADIQAAKGASTNTLSCIACHEQVAGMVLTNNDPDTGSFDADGSGTRGGPNSPYHYGQLPANLTPDNPSYCEYCHQDPNNATGFNAVFSNPLNFNVEHHPRDPGYACISCHNSGHLHEAALQKPVANTPFCQTCHPDKNQHNGVVTCIQCHTTDGHTPREIHGIKFIQTNGTWQPTQTSPANCETCHQGTGLTVDGFGTAPKVPAPVQHSADRGGQKWGNYWADESGACAYCHGDTRHVTAALGKVEQVRAGRALKAALAASTWCNACHVPGADGYASLGAAFGTPLPPGILANQANYPSTGTPFDHSGFVTPGTTSNICAGCHNLTGTTDQAVHKVSPVGS